MEGYRRLLLLTWILFLTIYMCGCLCVGTYTCVQVPEEARKGITWSGVGVISVCKSPTTGVGPLQEQYALLTTKPWTWGKG